MYCILFVVVSTVLLNGCVSGCKRVECDKELANIAWTQLAFEPEISYTQYTQASSAGSPALVTAFNTLIDGAASIKTRNLPGFQKFKISLLINNPANLTGLWKIHSFLTGDDGCGKTTSIVFIADRMRTAGNVAASTATQLTEHFLNKINCYYFRFTTYGQYGLTGPLGRPDKDNILPKPLLLRGRPFSQPLSSYPPPKLNVGWACSTYTRWSKLKDNIQFSFATSVQAFRDGLIARITKVLT